MIRHVRYASRNKHNTVLFDSSGLSHIWSNLIHVIYLKTWQYKQEYSQPQVGGKIRISIQSGDEKWRVAADRQISDSRFARNFVNFDIAGFKINKKLLSYHVLSFVSCSVHKIILSYELVMYFNLFQYLYFSEISIRADSKCEHQWNMRRKENV